MTSQKLYDALEICLQALDHGADMESCLALFPPLADDLRPLLTTALQARTDGVLEVPAGAARRGKARVLQAAAEMREQAASKPARPALRRWQNGWPGTRIFRLVITTVAMLAFLLTGGTGLVGAASSSLPGDHLYPVKRSWEDVRLFLVFNPNERMQLEQEFEQERFQEIEELYTAKRVAKVNFQGQLQTRSNGDWVVGGLDVSVNGNATPQAGIVSGVTVQVIGETDNGVIKAEQIILIITPTVIPENSPTISPSSTLAPTIQPTAAPTEMENTPQPTKNTELPALTNDSLNKSWALSSDPAQTRRPAAARTSENGGDTQDGE